MFSVHRNQKRTALLKWMMSLGPDHRRELKISEVFRVLAETPMWYISCAFLPLTAECFFKKSCSVIILKKFICVCMYLIGFFSCELPLWMLCCAHGMCCSGKKLCVLFLLYPVHETVANVVTRGPVVCTACQAVFIY